MKFYKLPFSVRMVLSSVPLALMLGLSFNAVALPMNPDEIEAGVIDEIRMGRGVYERNCMQCHAAPRDGSQARPPEARGFWEQRLANIGVQRMTQIVMKTHRNTDGIGQFVFEDIEMLRGAVRYMSLGGESGYVSSINAIQAILSQKNKQKLDEAIAALDVINPVVWGALSESYDDYHYMGPVYPFNAALSDVVNDKMEQVLSETVFIPSKRGEFEQLEDYNARIAFDKAVHESRYAAIVASKDILLKEITENWLNVLAGELSVPVDFSYDPDEEVFDFSIWKTPNQKRIDPLDAAERALESTIDASTDSLSIRIEVPIEIARSYKGRLSIEDPDNKPELFVVYDLQGLSLTAKAVVILWRDSNETEVINDIDGSLRNINLELSDEVSNLVNSGSEQSLTVGVTPTR